MIKKPLAFVDVETTGGSPSRDRITEIGIVRVENEKKVAEYKSLVNPHMHIPYFIQKMTGINQKMVESAPTFEEIKRDIAPLLSGATFVAHNARFDYSFIRGEYKRTDDSFTAKVMCTVRLSRILYPHYRKHSLEHLIERFSLSADNRHRAYDDAHALWEFYQKAKLDVGDKTFYDSVEKLLKGPRLPSYLKEKKLGPFPEEPGVYRFYGTKTHDSKGELLYVGKSTSLKKRIYSHFTAGNDTKSALMLGRFIKDIEITQKAGEFGSLLLEAREIKEKKPLLNKSLRKTNSYTIALEKTVKGYRSLEIASENDIDPKNHKHILAAQPTKKRMISFLQKLSDDHKLCPKLLGLEKRKGACFASQIGKCNGACTGLEKPLLYNMRFSQAFATTKVKPWPFDGAIVYKEESDITTEYHILDMWCHTETRTYKKDSETPEVKKYPLSFDWDIYKIIKKFLQKPQSHKHIKALKET